MLYGEIRKKYPIIIKKMSTYLELCMLSVYGNWKLAKVNSNHKTCAVKFD